MNFYLYNQQLLLIYCPYENISTLCFQLYFIHNTCHINYYAYICIEISTVMKSKGTNYTQKQKNILATLGENIKLSRLRRKLSIRSMAERAGIATSTLGNIEAGSPSVSLGSYLQVLSVLRLEDDLLLLADKDPIGRQIQDADLIVKKRAPKNKITTSVIEHVIDKGNSEKPNFD